MTQIITFLGKGGTGKTTTAIAVARHYASQGQRVLLISQDPGPDLEILLGCAPKTPQTIAANLSAWQLETGPLLEKAWEEIKKLEAQYLRSPILKNVYGEELVFVPGLAHALALNELRLASRGKQYDLLVFDGPGDQTSLTMWGIPDALGWYLRRFRQVFLNSDLGKAVSPFVQPFSSAIFNVTWTSTDSFAQEQTQEANQLLEQGKAAIADPQQLAAYLVTTPDPAAIATAKYLWGAAQQVNLTVGGVLLNRGPASLDTEFAPLPVITPEQGIPDLGQLAQQAPRPVSVDINERSVRLFLPGFDKSQVKLTQSGPEVTIEAGGLRRNLELPAQLSGLSVKGAKFQNGYLVINF